MRKLFFNLTVVFLVLSFYGFCFAAPILTIESATISEGQTTTIDVILSGNPSSGADAATAFDFKIPYSTSGLNAANLVAGSSISGLGGTFTPTLSSGLISALYFNLSSTIPVIPNGVLAIFDITGLVAGLYPLNFSVVGLGNVDGDDITDFQTVAGSVNVVPIPGAVWLLGGGLVSLVALRRRRS